jgi:hypothetical protein
MIEWEMIVEDKGPVFDNSTHRIGTPGGWIVRRGGFMLYIPDSEHVWLRKGDSSENTNVAR